MRSPEALEELLGLTDGVTGAGDCAGVLAEEGSQNVALNSDKIAAVGSRNFRFTTAKFIKADTKE